MTQAIATDIDNPGGLIPHKTSPGTTYRFQPGDSILDEPETPKAVWGDGQDILWAEGQSLIVAGHDGTGKTTFAGNLIRARLGITNNVLGMPVQPCKRNILVLMMDRPSQAKSNLARMFTGQHREILRDRLKIWAGPPPQDFAENPDLLAELCDQADADTCFVDSLKDAAIPISDEKVGGGWNRARQTAIREGVELFESHHPRKPDQDRQGKPPELADLYGSRWITAGCGSAIVLHGNPGDPVVKLYHRKPIVNPVGPWDVLIGEDGTVSLHENTSILDLIGNNGITAVEAAAALYGATGKNEVQKARRALDKETGRGNLIQAGGHRGGPPARWHKTTGRNLMAA